jgi:hypothetical protein
MGGTSGITGDSGPVPDAASTCGKKSSGTGSGGIGDAAVTCSVDQSYPCEGHTYELLCACPGSSCLCLKDGKSVGTEFGYVTCPSCSSPKYSALAAACGFPY